MNILNKSALLFLTLATVSCNSNSKAANNYPADNSGINQRDAAQGAPTSLDQKENAADLKITQQIRDSITSDKSFSISAQNIKVITANGVVTLRGPVTSGDEKNNIADQARRIAGVVNVDNQLEVIKS